jgi:alpha-mannosidase
VQVTGTDDGITLENGLVRALFQRDGALVSLFDKRAGREAITPGQRANQFVLYDDEPVAWDAWDVDVFHLEKRDPIGAATSIQITERGPLRASLLFTYQIGAGSTLTQTITLNAVSARLEFACEAHWQERHKFLKVEFPVAVRAEQATYEIQFGNVQRPTHFNTSWDLARFEVCAQRWADLAEPDFGVALLNDCKYGYAVHRNVMRLSLLRAPTYPDPRADLGQHAFRFALLPHSGTFREGDVVAEGYRFNAPMLVRPTSAAMQTHSFFAVDKPSVIIETVKKAEDGDGLIVRLYEAHGTRGRTRLSSTLPFTKAVRCNLIEDEQDTLDWKDGGVDLELTPFQMVTLKLS